jgi:hypothetical protein
MCPYFNVPLEGHIRQVLPAFEIAYNWVLFSKEHNIK